MSEQYISKGQYTYTQQSGYVTVKNYIFLEKNGKKCLILRLSNDSKGIEFNEMRFTVVEKDPAGRVIRRTRIEWEGLKLAPGATLACEKAIVVDDLCVDFRIEMECLISGQYKYLFGNGGVRVDFIPNEKKSAEKVEDADRIYENSVSRKQYGKPRLARLAAFVAILLIIAIAAIGIVSRYRAADGLDTEQGENGTGTLQDGDNEGSGGVKYEIITSEDGSIVGIGSGENVFEFSTSMEYEIITSEDGSIVGIGSGEDVFEFSTGMEYEIVTSQGGFTFEGFEGEYEYVTADPIP